jgi:hypothetical protein
MRSQLLAFADQSIAYPLNMLHRSRQGCAAAEGQLHTFIAGKLTDCDS